MKFQMFTEVFQLKAESLFSAVSFFFFLSKRFFFFVREEENSVFSSCSPFTLPDGEELE